MANSELFQIYKLFLKLGRASHRRCWNTERKNSKATYNQQAKAKPQYHPPKCEGIESDCKEQNHTLAAFLPKPPNTGFGDVRCRIGAERLFIYFIIFFLFSLERCFLSFKALLASVWISCPPWQEKSPGEPLKWQECQVSLLFPG